MARRRRNENAYRRPDRHTRAAKDAGYAARSVFKLEEIDRRTRLLKPGMHVLDLGAAPGSWSAYAAKRVGKRGRVVAIDRNPLSQALPPHCVVFEGDIFDDAIIGSALRQHAPYDVVLSDMAPNTTGDKRTDQLRSTELFLRALDLAAEVVKPGGAFVGKLFMSGDFASARDRVRANFAKARTLRPEAVRVVSYEVFLVGLERTVTAK